MAHDSADHAPEIAGFAAIVALVVPWSISFASTVFSGQVVFRFVFGLVRFSFGSLAADVEWTVLSVTEISTLYGGDLARVATLWFVAAVVLIVTLLLGFSLLPLASVSQRRSTRFDSWARCVCAWRFYFRARRGCSGRTRLEPRFPSAS